MPIRPAARTWPSLSPAVPIRSTVQFSGKSGMAGSIGTTAMMNSLNSGFAVAGEDPGHLASQSNNAGGAPGVYLPFLHDRDTVLTWIRNYVAVFSAPAKGVITKCYAETPAMVDYTGCSTDEVRGFALAQYHLDVFDGIVAESPGNWNSHLALSFLVNCQVNIRHSSRRPNSTSSMTRHSLDTCNANNGAVNGLIENPLACQIKLDSLACAREQSPTAATQNVSAPHSCKPQKKSAPG